jgi:catechol 2,3-dioxygenase-like lactoylglutathione lyase family enzyme
VTEYPTFRQVVLDCLDARRSAEFYRQLLGLRYETGSEPPAAGEPDPAGQDWLVLLGTDGNRLLAFQQVPTLRTATWPDGEVPQQLHLDFRVRSEQQLREQHERVLALGGRLLQDRIDDAEDPLRVYADLDGHPFCLFIRG